MAEFDFRLNGSDRELGGQFINLACLQITLIAFDAQFAARCGDIEQAAFNAFRTAAPPSWAVTASSFSCAR